MLTELLSKALHSQMGQIKAAFVFGSTAAGTDTAASDIDLLVVGDALDLNAMHAALQGAELRLHRKVQPLFLTNEEWRLKLSRKGSFVQRICSRPRIFLAGSENALLS